MQPLQIAIPNTTFPKPFAFNPLSSLLRRPFSPSLSSRRRLSLIRAHSPQSNHHHDHHNHNHHHHHHHEVKALSSSQEALMRFARATRWVEAADFPSEHLQLRCTSVALLLIAGACPYALPGAVANPLQSPLIAVAFPLVGVSAVLDASLEIAVGKVNIHVLMALAAFASLFMGNSLEAGLLLAMFNLAHIAEEYFTSRSMLDVKELKENNPEFALLLDADGDEPPHFLSLNYKEVPAHELELGSYILVKAGEAVPVDGEVCRGISTVTIEHLTGDAKPLERKVGDRIPGGARNLDGVMIVKVTSRWKGSTLNRIVQLTEAHS